MNKQAIIENDNKKLECPYCHGTTFRHEWDGTFFHYRPATGALASLFVGVYPERCEVTCRACGETSWLPIEEMKKFTRLTHVDWPNDER